MTDLFEIPGWTTIRRESGLIEHVCEHGTGHPNFYSGRSLDIRHNHEAGTWLTHGCDGCCLHPDFPGHKRSDEEILHRIGIVLAAHGEGLIVIEEAIVWVRYCSHDLGINWHDRISPAAPPG